MRSKTDDATDQMGVHGVWRLKSYYLENLQTGERTDVFGSSPNGVLTLLPEGRMFALLTPGERKRPVSEADEANAFRKIAANPPRAVAGIKDVLDQQRTARVSESLRYVAAWNAAFLPSRDLSEGIAATVARRPAHFTGD